MRPPTRRRRWRSTRLWTNRTRRLRRQSRSRRMGCHQETRPYRWLRTRSVADLIGSDEVAPAPTTPDSAAPWPDSTAPATEGAAQPTSDGTVSSLPVAEVAAVGPASVMSRDAHSRRTGTRVRVYRHGSRRKHGGTNRSCDQRLCHGAVRRGDRLAGRGPSRSSGPRARRVPTRRHRPATRGDPDAPPPAEAPPSAPPAVETAPAETVPVADVPGDPAPIAAP